jgi:hypothetical protein
MKGLVMRKRNLVGLAVFVAALFLVFVVANQPVSRAATPARAAAPAAPQTTREVIFGAMKPYVSKSGWFNVSFPENWTVNDKSVPTEAILLVSDPTENGVIVIRVYESPAHTQSELADVLKTYIHDKMSGFDAFSMGEPTPQKDGSTNLVFHYTQGQDNQNYRMYGEGFIQQRNGFLGVIVLLIPQEQYSAKSKSAYQIIDSFHVTGKKQ